MTRYDIFFYEAFTDETKFIYRSLPTEINAGFSERTIQELRDESPPARVIGVRTQSLIPLDWGGRLDAVLTRSTGYDHLKQWREQTGTRAACGYLPNYCAGSVAEHAALMWLALLRRLPRQERQFRRFARDDLTGRECAGKRLAVVGVGNIGYEVIRIARGLRMETRGVDLVERHPDVDYAAPEEALAHADVIVCTMNLTDDNRGYFDFERLGRVPRGAIFVNVSRGELSPPDVLLRYVASGHLGGVGLDVYDDESSIAVEMRREAPRASPGLDTIRALGRNENVILTPHNAFNTREAVIRKAEQSVEQLLYLRRHGDFRWSIPDSDSPLGAFQGESDRSKRTNMSS